jgi:hypothetical protein
MFNYEGRFAIFHNLVILIIFSITIWALINFWVHPLPKPKTISYSIDPFFYQKLLIRHFESLKTDSLKTDTIPKVRRRK